MDMLVRMSVEERRADKAESSVSEVRYAALAKRRLGHKLRGEGR